LIDVKQLLERLRPAATAAAAHSYAPYSHFPVGAAVLDASGRVFAGCNVENASYGLTQCAERAALTAAIASGATPRAMTALLIYTPGSRACSPCGACRQVMHELLAENGLVVSCCDSGDTLVWRGDEHLPQPFSPEDLLVAREDGR